MRCVSNRIKLESLPDFFGPRELGRVLGVSSGRAYRLARSEGFPAKRIGRKLIISKAAFLRWFEENSGK